MLSTLFANIESAVNIAGAMFFPLMNLGGSVAENVVVVGVHLCCL